MTDSISKAVSKPDSNIQQKDGTSVAGDALPLNESSTSEPAVKSNSTHEPVESQEVVFENHTPKPDALVGQTIDGKYLVQSVLGRGGMGLVYKAQHALMNRTVAIKILHSHLIQNEDSLRRFRHEAQVASKLNHPHAITMYDFGIFNGQPFLVMEYVEGITLKERISKDGALPLSTIRSIFEQICSALQEAHNLGIVHRDLKPDNIIIRTKDDGTEYVEVLDFGIAKLLDQSGEKGATIVTQQGMFFGTPQYASPEQALGNELDARSDIYSLGVILYEALTGMVPFDAPSMMEVLLKHINASPEPIRKRKPECNFPKKLEDIVIRCLEKDPAKRYQKVRELNEDLRSCQETPAASPGLHYGPLAVFAGLGIAIIVGVWYLLFWPSSEPLEIQLAENSTEETSTKDQSTSITAPQTKIVPPVETKPKEDLSQQNPSTETSITLPGTNLVATEDTSSSSSAESIVTPPEQPKTDNVLDHNAQQNSPSLATNISEKTNIVDTSNAVANTAKLVVKSTPPGAEVFLDQVSRGRTPLTISELEPRSYALTVKEKDFQDFNAQVTLGTKETITQVADLKPLDQKKLTRAEAVALFQKADKFYRQKNYREAAPLFEQGLTGHPSSVKAHLTLGICYLRLGKRDLALSQFVEALKHDKTYPPTYFNLACYYALAGEPDKAMKALQKTIELEPSAKRWAKDEQDLSSLRALPKFQELIR